MNNVYLVNKRVEHLYNKYNISFSSKNKLFKHLRKTCRKFKIIFETASGAFDATFQINETSSAAPIINNAKVITIIHFIAELRDVIAKSDYNFRNWKYVIFKIRYLPNLETEKNDIFSNFECEVTLNNRAYLLKNVFKLKIKKMVFFISIRGVGNKVVNTNRYVMIIVYVNDVINDIIKTICFTMMIYLMNDLKINSLLETNIITPQKMIMNLKTYIIKFGKCQELKISIDVII